MPKKTRIANRSVQQGKHQARKGFELVYQETPASIKKQPEMNNREDSVGIVATANSPIAVVVLEDSREHKTTNRKSSASARLAVSTRATKKSTEIMSAEDLGYMKHDLTTIGILAAIMIAILLIFYAFLG